MRHTRTAAQAARPMGRGAFLRGMGAAAVAGAALGGFARPVRANPDPGNIIQSGNDYTVYPTGTGQDHTNLQWVVDQDNVGTVTLMKYKNDGTQTPAMFRIGVDAGGNTLVIKKSVRLVGQKDSNPQKAKIYSDNSSASDSLFPPMPWIRTARPGIKVAFSNHNPIDVSLVNLEIDGKVYNDPNAGMNSIFLNPTLISIGFMPPFLGFGGMPRLYMDRNPSVKMQDCRVSCDQGVVSVVGVKFADQNRKLDVTVEENCEIHSYKYYAYIINFSDANTVITDSTLIGTNGVYVSHSTWPMPYAPGNEVIYPSGHMHVSGNIIKIHSYYQHSVGGKISSAIEVRAKKGFSADFIGNDVHVNTPAPTSTSEFSVAVVCGSFGTSNIGAILYPWMTEKALPEDIHFDDLNIYSESGYCKTLLGIYAQNCSFSRISLKNPVDGNSAVLMTETPVPGFPLVIQNESNNNSFDAIDFSMFTASMAQIECGYASYNNTIQNSEFGALDLSSAYAGAYIEGTGHWLNNVNFPNGYPGINVPEGQPKVPCVWLTADSSGNKVTALKNGISLQGLVLCSQLLNDNPTGNIIPGYSACTRVPDSLIESMEIRRCAAMGCNWNNGVCEPAPPEEFEPSFYNLPPLQQ